MGKKKTLEEYKEQFYNKFPDSELKILRDGKTTISPSGSSNKYIIVSDKYGEIETSRNNLLSGTGYTMESVINKESYLTNLIKERFPQNLEKYEIIEYKDSRNTIVRTKYGLCSVFKGDLLSGYIPTIKAALNKTEFFINKAKEVHGNKYNYDNIKYIDSYSKFLISCEEHGNFKQCPVMHLSGEGCPECGKQKVIDYHSENPSGWSKTNWWKTAQTSKDFTGFKVYIIKCWNENEEFYKIGRTFRNINLRFKSLPYKYNIIKLFESNELTEENTIKIFNLEIELKRKNKKYKYIPNLKFNGSKECFKQIKDYATNNT